MDSGPTGVRLLLIAIATLAASGAPAYALPRRSPRGQRIAACLMAIGSALGLYAVARSSGAGGSALVVDWTLPLGSFSVAVDPLSAVFLILVFIVPALASVYALGYWKSAEHPASARRLHLASGILAASMALVAVARDGVLFLVAWEAMALSAYFAATAEPDDPAVREAGWAYLIATHIGTAFLIAMFAYWGSRSGSFALLPRSGIPRTAASAVFALSLIGFGFKAGLMPLHVWLPGAHSAAPSHVSAVMSGVMLKMGLYGILRTMYLFPAPPGWWGGLLLAAGAVSGVTGIAFAAGQSDVKRALAYSSVENVGIITMGIGLASLGRAHGNAVWIVLGLGAALFHVWNHGLFKPLLFFGAGAVIRATGTRCVDALGGLGKRMPRTMALFAVGSVAICALPPLNGFVGELLLYAGLFRTLWAGSGASGAAAPGAAAAAAALAMIGALSLATFVKLFGAVFLGSPRTPAGQDATDPSPAMIAPMVVLALACAAIGLFPAVAIHPIERAAALWCPDGSPPAIAALVPLRSFSALGLSLSAFAVVAALALRFVPKSALGAKPGTWDCGYAAPKARMEYTGSSFTRSVVGLFKYVVFPRNTPVSIRGPFPEKTEYGGDVPDTVYDRLVLPAARMASRFAPRLKFLQRGWTQLYLLYLFAALILLLIGGGVL